jgi:RNA polymerase sigma-70 factor (ECF subfamily)
MNLVRTPPAGSAERDESTSSDSDLVKLSLEGDTRAFEALCKRYLPELRRRARLVAADLDLVDECIQQTLIRVHRSLATFDVNRAFRPWLMTIFANTLKSSWVQAKKVLYYEDIAGASGERTALLGSTELDPQTVVEREEKASEKQELLSILGQCVEGLDEDSRKLYRLIFVDHLNHRTVAEILGISHDSCRQRSVRLRRILRTCVEAKSKHLHDGGSAH